jgi:predicted nuclease of predicted toxin-antitoxin system
LLDSCIWPGARTELKRAGHEVEWVGDWSADPGDDEILAHAARNGQVLVTLDKDFGELAVALGAAHAGIIRLVDLRYLEQAPVCAHAIAEHQSDLAQSAIVTVERSRTRVRLPDTRSDPQS